MNDENDGLQDFLPNFNVAPTQSTPVLLGVDKRKIQTMRWGLIPSWAKDKSFGSRLINARVETLDQKASFRNLVARRHCAVIAQGYYEWQRTVDGKIPYFIHAKSGKLLLMAGLWDSWRSLDDEVLSTFTIVTTNAVLELADIHHRMPVVLSPEVVDEWLNISTLSKDKSMALLNASRYALDAYPVSKIVNSVKNNSPVCHERVSSC